MTMIDRLLRQEHDLRYTRGRARVDSTDSVQYLQAETDSTEAM